MSATIYQGAVGPEAYVLDVTPGTSGVDLSTVTTGTLSVRKSTGTKVSWTAVLSNQTPSTLTLTYTFALGDVDASGTYHVVGVLAVPSGTVRTKPVTLIVKDSFDPS